MVGHAPGQLGEAAEQPGLAADLGQRDPVTISPPSTSSVTWTMSVSATALSPP